MSGPRSVTDWYTDAITVLEKCRSRVERMKGPIVQDDLMGAVRLAKELVALDEEHTSTQLPIQRP